jgi:uncharacterized membrane protein
MDDRRVETLMGNVLRIGVLLAAVVVLAGGALYIAQHHAGAVSYRTFVAGTAETRTLTGIAASATRLHGEGLIQLGLLLLIATPIARVVFAVAGFALERDRLYACISLIVLAILIFSLLHAT